MINKTKETLKALFEDPTYFDSNYTINRVNSRNNHYKYKYSYKNNNSSFPNNNNLSMPNYNNNYSLPIIIIYQC